MKSPLAIVVTAVVLVAVGTLAIMNNACKSGQHEWCAPMSTIPHHIKTGQVKFGEHQRFAFATRKMLAFRTIARLRGPQTLPKA